MKKYGESPLSFLSDEKLNDYLALMGHDFSDKDTKEIIQKTLQKSKKKMSWFEKNRYNRKKLLLIAAFILLVLIPGTVYAANKIWEIYFQQNHYSTKLTIQKKEIKSEPELEISESEIIEEKSYRVEMSYLPENWGPIPHNEGEVPMKFWNTVTYESEETISTLLVKLSNQNEFESRYSKDSEEINAGKHKAWLVNKTGQYNSALDRS